MNQKWTDEEIQAKVKLSVNWSDLHRRLGGNQVNGAVVRNLKKRCIQAGIDFSHFVTFDPDALKKASEKRQVLSVDILVHNPDLTKRVKRSHLLRGMQEMGVSYFCEMCNGDGTWLSESIILEIDHKDGDWRNNKIDNLRFLCPNCHVLVEIRSRKQRTETSYASKKRTCLDCSVQTSPNGVRCRSCASRLISMEKGHPTSSLTVAQIETLVNLHGWTGAGKIIGVSDVALRKRYERAGGDPKAIKRNYMP